MNIKKYWNRTKHNMEWNIAYRDVGKNSIINDLSTPFQVFETPKNTWCADPFLFSYNNKIYLFYELYENKRKKGVVAYSEYDGENFLNPNIIIDEPFHLSFPCVFEHRNKLYIIPESGSQRNLCLYECDLFPNRWHLKSVLLDNINSSDNIIYDVNGDKYIIASILIEGTGKAKNVVYKIDFETYKATFCYEIDGCGENGYRNAGSLFNFDKIIYRPGQNCPNGEYGKSLYLHRVDQFSPNTYTETFFSEITVNDISILNQKKDYIGVHTYSIDKNFGVDVIDLKYYSKNSLIKRIKMMLKTMIQYIKIHIKA